jgi:Ca2+-binding RTX toxin-like protein
MKLFFPTIAHLCRAIAVTLAAFSATAAFGAPSIQSVNVSPSPLALGQDFIIAVTTSPDVTQAIATVDFRPGTQQVQIVLSKVGAAWTGSGVVPSELPLLLPGNAGAMAQVAAFDSAGRRSEAVVQLGVTAPTISAVFANGILTVTGDEKDNTIVVGSDTTGKIVAVVDGATLPISGGVPTTNNTLLIRIFGFAGNDSLRVDDVNGFMPPASLFGGDGDDTLTGSGNADELNGGAGNDTLIGGRGNDVLIGGPGNDVLIGGPGVDQLLGGDGDDQIVWNPGDGSDVVEGGSGSDLLIFNGANANEEVDLSANGPRLRFFRNVANITMDCDGVERVLFRALGGTDQVTVNDLSGTQVSQVTIDLSAAAGNPDGAADTIRVNGTAGNDRIVVTTSTNGVDVSGLSATVTIVGVDTNLDQLFINGHGGSDVAEFIGGNESEVVDLFADQKTFRFSSDSSAIGVGLDEVEQVTFHALGGADQVTIHDLTGTSVSHVLLDLASAGGTGDGQADTIVVNGTETNDVITIAGSADALSIVGLAATVTVAGAEPGLDKLIINALGGADVVDASSLTSAINLTLNGGPGNDTLIGGAGDDLLIGGQGVDVMRGGPGNDTFVWNPGDGSDVIEGEAGQDTLIFNGANIAEIMDLSANGSRLRFTRNVGSIVMDCNGVETIQVTARGGADTISINDLTGTGVTNVSLDLAGTPGSGQPDNDADNIFVSGTSGNDVATITNTGAAISIVGLSAVVNIVGSSSPLDRLTMLMLDGDDVCNASGLQGGIISLTINGGPGNDVLIGSAGDDSLFGDLGDDILNGGPGFDLLDGGPGANVLIQD